MQSSTGHSPFTAALLKNIAEGKTALSIAYVNGQRQLIDVLLTHGARERVFLGIALYRSAESTDVQARHKPMPVKSSLMYCSTLRPTLPASSVTTRRPCSPSAPQ